MGKVGESLKAGLEGGLVGMSKTPGFMDVIGSISPLAGLVSGRGAFGTFTRKKSKEEEEEDKVVKPTKGGATNMRKGGKLPDLTGDGKVTRADVLKGRGVKGFAKGGSTASKRADGCAVNGKTKGKFV